MQDQKETHRQKVIRQAHVIIRAFDAVIWADPRDEKAVDREVNRLWRQGWLTTVLLPASIEERLTPANRKAYEVNRKLIMEALASKESRVSNHPG